MYFSIVFVIFALLLFFVLSSCRRRWAIKKVYSMCCAEKCRLLNTLIEPFGYCYIECQDIISSRNDAWQRSMGYTSLFDHAASHFNMVFDCLPVYFNYRNRTWLIEFWKGQYGINAGGEIGIYHADRLLSETEYRTAHFKAAEGDEMLSCTLQLCLENGACVKISERHWWLTVFLPGVFSQPSGLCMKASLCFQNREMLEAFYRGLCRAGCSSERITVQNLCLSFMFHQAKPVHYGFLTRLRRRLSQCMNRMFCRLFLWVTRPFTCTEDRILFLYYYIPFCFRKLMRLRRFHRRCHRKNGCRSPECCRRCRPHRGKKS